MISLENFSARKRLRAIRAPTTSWWWKLTPPPGWNSRVARLADVVQQRRQPQDQVGLRRRLVRLLQVDRLRQHGQRVLVDVLVLVVLVDRQPHRRAPRAARRSASPVSTSSSSPAAGRAASSSFDSSACTRSAVIRSISLGHRRHRVDHPRRGGEAELRGEPGGPQHPQRVVGERLLRRRRGVEDPLPQRAQPVVRVDERLGRQLDGHRVDREVAAEQVALDACRRR